MFLWTAFNAAHASEFDQDEPERERLRPFFALRSLDAEKQLLTPIKTLVKTLVKTPVKTLVKGEFSTRANTQEIGG